MALLALLALLAHLVFAGAATAQRLVSETQYTLSDAGHMIIDVMVKGEGPFPFIVDTAASFPVAYPRLTVALGLEPRRGRVVGRATSGYVNGQLYDLGTIRIGDGLERRISRAVGLPQMNQPNFVPAGILGAHLFYNYTLLVDAPGKRLVLYRRGEALSLSRNWPALDIEIRAGLAYVGVNLTGVPTRALVDTGATRTIINIAALRSLGYEVEDARLKGVRQIRGAGPEPTEAREIEGVILNLGARTFGAQNFLVSNLPIFEAFDRGGAAIIMGMDVLGQQSFVLDYANYKLLLGPGVPVE